MAHIYLSAPSLYKDSKRVSGDGGGRCYYPRVAITFVYTCHHNHNHENSDSRYRSVHNPWCVVMAGCGYAIMFRVGRVARIHRNGLIPSYCCF